MFGFQALDVAIGLVMVFLLVSLLLTAALEMLEALLKTRAANLQKAIILILGGTSQNSGGTDNDLVRTFYNHPLVFALYMGAYQQPGRIPGLGAILGKDLPSYIPREIFSAVAMDLEASGTAGSKLHDVLSSFRKIYGDDANTLKANIENWYDGVMDRASGWYKRRSQWRLFWLGLAAAIGFNINPIVIGQHLSTTQAARDKMIALADNAISARASVSQISDDDLLGQIEKVRQTLSKGDGLPAPHTSAPDGQSALPDGDGQRPLERAGRVLMQVRSEDLLRQLNEAHEEISKANDQERPQKIKDAREVLAKVGNDDLLWEFDKTVRDVGLPIGWSEFARSRTLATGGTGPEIAAALLTAVAGWLVTALAATLGAPFWFDVLNKLMVIRATVKPKEKSQDEVSEDRTGSAAHKGPQLMPASQPSLQPLNDGAVG